MITPTVNYLAVFMAAVASMILGALWYSPLLFGKVWMHASKMSEKDIKKANMGKAYGLTFIASLLTAYILAHFVDYLEASTLSLGFIAAFWIWLGFYTTSSLDSVLWENKSWTLYIINIAYRLLSLVVMASILVLWV